MIAQQELQNLLNLPDQEKLLLAHRLLESVIAKTNGQLTTTDIQPMADESANEPDGPSLSAKWWLSMAGMYSGGPGNTAENADEICSAEIGRQSQPVSGFPETCSESRPPNPLMEVAGMFSGKAVNTGENADEICLAEVNRRSGFTTKPPLEDALSPTMPRRSKPPSSNSKCPPIFSNGSTNSSPLSSRRRPKRLRP